MKLTCEDGARRGPVVSISSWLMDNVVYLCSRTAMEKVFVACVIGCLFGCGSKNQAADDTTSADAIKTPATVEQAARVLDLSTFPLMDGAKPPESRQVANLFYLATGDVKTAFEFNRKALVAQGWVPYGDAGDSAVFKQNANLVTATVSSAPAQGGKTMIQYSNQLISVDIPAPPNVEELRYVDEPPELTFATANQHAIVDFYRKTLATAGWKSTMDHMVDVDEKPTMIFRNPGKDMLTLAASGVLRGKLLFSVRFQSAAEIAERDRKIKEAAPKLRAAAEAKAAKEAKEAAELAERNKVPKVAVTLPADAKAVKQTNDSIKFTVGKGKAKEAVESFRTQFREAGWKEDVASMAAMAGTLLFSKGDGQSVNITYSDTGFMPTEVSLSGMRVEFEAAK